jgi:phosphoribosyl 1,2-cyclic phosphate phosphodiesterase
MCVFAAPGEMATQMILTFLGTAAANAFPEAFCKCQNCSQARMLGGPSLRKRSAALVNDDLLIDLGPDIMSASHMHGCSLDHVRYCLQTHPHADHLDLSHLLSRSPDYGVVGAPVLNVYASRETSERAAQTFERDLAGYSLLSPEAEKRLNFKMHQIRPLEPFMVGPYSVMAFPANHAPGMGAMLYSIEANGRAIFYGTDTATLFEQTWQAFREHKMRFDAAILDHTYGPEQPGGDHLNAHQVIEHADRMRAEGVLGPHGRVFATHIAHEGNPAHPALAAFAKQHAYEVAYDGLILTI